MNLIFKPFVIEGFRKEAGLNAFTVSLTRWVEATNAKGIKAISGRYGGTYAISDIAFEFASWVSVEFKLYLVREFQRLKADEQKQLAWTAKRELSKINYRIHTDAIKENLIPTEVTREQELISLKKIDDSFRKIIIVGDDIATYMDENGYVFMGLFQFLKNEDVME